MTGFMHLTRETARDAVRLYFEPLVWLWGLFRKKEKEEPVEDVDPPSVVSAGSSPMPPPMINRPPAPPDRSSPRLKRGQTN